MAEELKVREGSRVSLRETGCCSSRSHSGFGVVVEIQLDSFRVAQGGNRSIAPSNWHNIECIDKVIKY